MSFVPGHVSLTFAICPDDNPLKMGSTGIGLVLSKGVHCAVIDEKLDSPNTVSYTHLTLPTNREV